MEELDIRLGGYGSPLKSQIKSQGYDIEDEWAKLFQKYNDEIWNLYCNDILDFNQMEEANKKLLIKIKKAIYKPTETLF